MKSPARREDFVNSVVKAFTVDRALSGLLNVAVYEHGSDNFEATPKALRTYVNCEMSHTVNIIDLVCTRTTAVAGAIVE